MDLVICIPYILRAVFYYNGKTCVYMEKMNTMSSVRNSQLKREYNPITGTSTQEYHSKYHPGEYMTFHIKLFLSIIIPITY